MKALLVLIWLLVGVFYWWLHNDSHQACCDDQAVVSAQLENDDSNTTAKNLDQITKEENAPLNAPISFNFSDSKPIIGTGFEKMKDSLMSVLNAEQVIEIIGKFSPNEAYNGTLTNLGLERAENIKNILSDYLDESRIVTTSSMLNSVGKDDTKPGIYSSLALKIRTAKIKEINDRTLIYFPYNSTSRLEDEELENYLDAVAERLEKTGERIFLTGHTDSSGDASYNYRLGLSRAKIVQRYLVKKGIPSDRIKVDSKGETSPIAPNNTEEGRSKNRRTELVITE